MKLVRSAFLAVALVVSSGSVATAQDLDKGLAAAQAGDFVTALEEWRPLAEQGNARAQFNLGVMYSNGDGVPQNYAEAVRWYDSCDNCDTGRTAEVCVASVAEVAGERRPKLNRLNCDLSFKPLS
tara:strand:+ start:293 stop:667 length:375 start_codon:yes stop_codon:yes gene_type:complete